MDDQPNDDQSNYAQPNNVASLYLLGSASLVASIVLALVWVFTQWWA
jgi:hypothetical protein